MPIVFAKPVTLTTGWDLANATYDTVSLPISSLIETAISGGHMSSDGTKLYITGQTGHIHQYTLPTPWSLVGATFSNKETSLIPEDPVLGGVFFKSDGAKMYVIGSNASPDTMFQYSLSTAWDANSTSVSYDNISKVMSDGFQLTGAVGNFFSPDGSRMFVMDYQTDLVIQYALPTPWSLTGSLYDSKNLFVGNEDSFGTGIFFKPDGLTMFLLGNTNNMIYQYNLGNAWDFVPSTTSYSGISYDVSAQSTLPVAIFFSPDGLKMFVFDGALNSSTIYQYTLPAL